MVRRLPSLDSEPGRLYRLGYGLIRRSSRLARLRRRRRHGRRLHSPGIADLETRQLGRRIDPDLSALPRRATRLPRVRGAYPAVAADHRHGREPRRESRRDPQRTPLPCRKARAAGESKLAAQLAFLDETLLYRIERLARLVAPLVRCEGVIEVFPQRAMLCEINLHATLRPLSSVT